MQTKKISDRFDNVFGKGKKGEQNNLVGTVTSTYKKLPKAGKIGVNTALWTGLGFLILPGPALLYTAGYLGYRGIKAYNDHQKKNLK